MFRAMIACSPHLESVYRNFGGRHDQLCQECVEVVRATILLEPPSCALVSILCENVSVVHTTPVSLWFKTGWHRPQQPDALRLQQVRRGTYQRSPSLVLHVEGIHKNRDRAGGGLQVYVPLSYMKRSVWVIRARVVPSSKAGVPW